MCGKGKVWLLTLHFLSGFLGFYCFALKIIFPWFLVKSVQYIYFKISKSYRFEHDKKSYIHNTFSQK